MSCLFAFALIIKIFHCAINIKCNGEHWVSEHVSLDQIHCWHNKTSHWRHDNGIQMLKLFWIRYSASKNSNGVRSYFSTGINLLIDKVTLLVAPNINFIIRQQEFQIMELITFRKRAKKLKTFTTIIFESIFNFFIIA